MRDIPTNTAFFHVNALTRGRKPFTIRNGNENHTERGPLTVTDTVPKIKAAWEVHNDRLLLQCMFLWAAALLLAVPAAATINREWGTLPADLFRILTSPSKLVTDYFAIGSLSAALLNAGLCGLACAVLMLFSHIDPDARALAGFFLVVAHCFYGLNLLNMWPPFIGVLLFCLVTRRRFADEVHTAMFATSLGPFISDFLFRYTLGDAYVFDQPQVTPAGILLALAFGIASGFVIPALLPGTTKMHRGYNLYKAGLAIGLFGTFVYALMYRTFGVSDPVPPTRDNPDYIEKGSSYGEFMVTFFLVMLLGMILLGFLLNGKSFRHYTRLLQSSGLDTDFSEKFGTPLCMINIGVYGLCILTYMTLVILISDGAGFTGPTAGVIIAALTFSASGQTPRNVWPIVLGYTLFRGFCAAVTAAVGGDVTWTLSTQGYINGLAFATGLCPFSGKYGWKIGTIAGFADAIICTSTSAMHGGFVLYNGGFAAGLTALLLIPILDYYNVPLRRQDEPPALSPEEQSVILEVIGRK